MVNTVTWMSQKVVSVMWCPPEEPSDPYPVSVTASSLSISQGGGPRCGDQRSDHLRCQGDGDAATGE